VERGPPARTRKQRRPDAQIIPVAIQYPFRINTSIEDQEI
jgi:hypothetical protein